MFIICTHSIFLKRKWYIKYVSKYQGFQSFKPRYVLTMQYFSKPKKILKLLRNIRIILPFNKIQLLQKQQFVNYLVKNLLVKTKFDFLYFTFSLRNMGNMYSTQSNYWHFYALMITVFKVGLPLCKIFGFFCFSESPLKLMKKIFYFILKALFVLKIFKFLSWLFGHVEKTTSLER